MIRAILFLLLSAYVTGVEGQSTMGRITVSGNEFVDEQGKVVVFRGFSSKDPNALKNENRWNEAYFEEIKKWGATIVRIPIHPRDWRKRGKDAYLQLLDEGIAWATANNLYVIIDWHSIGNLKTSLFLNDRYYTDLAETYNFWKTIIARYGKNPTVAFYELFNEPTTYNNRFGKLSWDEWKPIMEDLIVMVRANEGEGIPLVAGFNWAYDLTPIKLTPIDADGIGYISHPYPQKREKPWPDQWTADWGFAKEKYPIILSEIGYCAADDHGAHIPVISDESYGKAITSYADERNISYVVWVFDNDWSPRLFIDNKFTPSDQGKFWKKKMKSY
ncbi:MAG: cellulase family glycosylhydrolase [Bacteroidota bacterium]